MGKVTINNIYTTPELYFNWSRDNQKLKDTYKRDGLRIIGFSLPAGKACPEAGICRRYCYGRSGHFVQSQVTRPHEENWEKANRWLKRENYQGLATKLSNDVHHIEEAGFDGVRVHVTGDFFSYEYAQAWVLAARQANIRLYAYTKSLKLIQRAQDEYDLWPDNFKIIQSVGGASDKLIDPCQPMAQVFATQEELASHVAWGWSDGSVSDAPAFRGDKRIALKYHGHARKEETIRKLLMT